MMEDTQIGGAQSQFPLTQWSAIVAARSDNSSERKQAFDTIIAAYWKPIYKTIRIKWNKSNEDAKDLTQGFFTKVIEKDFLKTFDPEKARFRTFIRKCLDGFVANEEKAANRIKRGGNQQILSLDFEGVEKEMSLSQVTSNQTPADFFDKEWLRSLFSIAVGKLRKECNETNKSLYFDLFERYDLNREEVQEKLT